VDPESVPTEPKRRCGLLVAVLMAAVLPLGMLATPTCCDGSGGSICVHSHGEVICPPGYCWVGGDLVCQKQVP